MRKTIVGTAAVAVLLLFSLVSHAQNVGQGTVHIMMLLGVDSPEDLDENEVEALSAFLDSPLEINIVSPSKLIASGLFTPYRAASLMDYRSSHGDVLSLAELAAVDGFSEEFVSVLAPFISLYSKASPGRATEKTTGTRNFLTARGATRKNGDADEYSYGVKYRLEIGDSFSMGLSANKTYGNADSKPDGGSFYFAWYGDKQLGKIVVGDYRLRFGQGLLLWSGFRMDSLSSPEAFSSRSSGISPYWSFSGDGSYRGIAADFNVGKFVISSAVAVNGLRKLMDGDKNVNLSLMPTVNVSWYGSKVRVGVTSYCTTGRLNGDFVTTPVTDAGVSADFRWCPRGTDVFGEVATDLLALRLKGLLGAIFRISDPVKLALRGEYEKDEYKLSSVASFSGGKYVQIAGKSGFGSSVKKHSGSLGMEMTWFPGRKYGADGPNYQLKVMANYSMQFSPSLAMVVRYSLRLRSAGEKSKNDLRCDLKYSSGEWSGTLRLNALYNTSLGLLSYIEGGWAPSWVSMYLRAGMFRIDNWADRIYVYERDAPGNFSVPAYYGRGYWAAFTAGAKVAGWCKIYLRLSTLQYPWTSPTASERTPKTEGKLMVVINL